MQRHQRVPNASCPKIGEAFEPITNALNHGWRRKNLVGQKEQLAVTFCEQAWIALANFQQNAFAHFSHVIETSFITTQTHLVPMKTPGREPFRQMDRPAQARQANKPAKIGR